MTTPASKLVSKFNLIASRLKKVLDRHDKLISGIKDKSLSDPKKIHQIIKELEIKAKNNLEEFTKFENEWDEIIKQKVESEIEIYDNFYKKHDYLSYMSKLRDIIEDIQIILLDYPLDEPEDVAVIQAKKDNSQNVVVVDRDKPKKQFTGNILDFEEFYEDFKNTIHVNTSLSSADKLKELKSRVDQGALKCLKKYTTGADYPDALERLKTLYGNTREIQRHIRRSLTNLRYNKDNPKGLRELYEDASYLLVQGSKYGLPINSIENQELLEKIFPIHIVNRVLDVERLNKGTGSDLTVEGFLSRLDELIIDTDRLTLVRDQPKTKNPGKTTNDSINSNIVASSVTAPKSQKKRQKQCYICESKEHYTARCTLPKSIEELKSIAKSKNLCRRCYIKGHKSDECRRTFNCHHCNSKEHHPLTCQVRYSSSNHSVDSSLIITSTVSTKKSSKKGKAADNTNNHGNVTESQQVVASIDVVNQAYDHQMDEFTLLMTVDAVICNPQDSRIRETVTCLLDPCATLSLINNNLANKLQLSANPDFNQYQTANGTRITTTEKYQFLVELNDGNYLQCNALGSDQLLKNIPKPQDLKNLLTNKALLNQPIKLGKCQPLILLSAKEYGLISYDRPVEKLDNNFRLVHSRIGPYIEGTGIIYNPYTSGSTIAAVYREDDLEKLWNLESLGIKDDPDVDESRLFKMRFDESVEQWEDGTICVELPFQTNELLGNNKINCLSRLRSVAKKCAVDPVYKERYINAIQEFVDLGFVTEISIDEFQKPDGHYLPHSLVITEGKSTSIRFVIDGSCKTENGRSINDFLLKGENLMASLAGILLRSRFHKIVVTSDIRKAFLQIALGPKSKKYVRFLFLKDPAGKVEIENLVVYEFCVVPFGLVSSPNILLHAIEYHLKNQQQIHPTKQELLENVMQMTYVDNNIIVADTVADAIEDSEFIRETFQRGHMILRNHISNSTPVNNYYGVEHDQKFNFLGIKFNTETDEFIIGWKDSTDPKVVNPRNKKQLLSVSAMLFDPLGLVAPIQLALKLLLRKAWQQKRDWSSLFDDEFVEEIRLSLEERLGFVFKIPRLLFSFSSNRFILLAFADASGEGLGVVIYLKNCISCEVSLIFGKSRLTPIKPVVTIPKLELTAMALANHLVQFVSDELKCLINIESKYIFTDSTTCLHWVNQQELKNRFVSNRVIKLQQGGCTFRYVPTELNPADIASRGCSPKSLQENSLWWKGPSFLTKPEEEWPSFVVDQSDTTDIPVIAASIDSIKIPEASEVISAVNVSSWYALKKKYMILIQFMFYKMPKTFGEKFKNISIFYLVEIFLLRQIQRRQALTERRMLELELYMDDQGILRRHSRVSHYPDGIYLPQCRETELLILHIHRLFNHASITLILGFLNRLYYIPKLRQFIKKVLRNECMECRKETAVPFALPVMNNLPECRTTGYPFQHVGTDLCGPFQCYIDNQLQVVYVCLFTCLHTRVSHLEVISGLAGEDFIDGFTRFVSRRGTPNIIYSDNATNYAVASKTVIPLWKEKKDSGVLEYCTSKSIEWRFIVERAPWHGGVYESIIKLIKQHLKRAMGRRRPTFWKFITIIHQIESYLNARPLTYYDDESLVLRPIDFISPGARTGVPFSNFEDQLKDPDYLPQDSTHDKLIALWKKNLQVSETFFKNFHQDYLTLLKNRSRFHHGAGNVIHREPQLDEIVLIADENKPRTDWKLGRITAVEKGSDNLCRAAQVQLGTNPPRFLRRPINHLLPLEVDPYLVKNPTPKSKVDKVKTKTLRVPSISDLPLITLIVLCLVSLVNGHKCSSNNVGIIKAISTCVSEGYYIKEYDHRYCWSSFSCPNDTHGIIHPEKQDRVLCSEKCQCASWTTECSFYANTNYGNSTITNVQIQNQLNKLQPPICSLKSNDISACDEEGMTYDLFQIQLLDNSLHIVSDLKVTHRQHHDDAFSCLGEDLLPDGPKEFCLHHNCKDNSSKICIPDLSEQLIFSPLNVEIKGYGIVKQIIHHYKKKNEKVNINVTCNSNFLKFENILVNDLFQISTRKYDFFFHVDSIEENQWKIPKELNIVETNYFIQVWRTGKVVDSLHIACQSIDYCSQIDCYICLELIANFECRTWTLVSFTIICIVFFILILIEITYLIFRWNRIRAYYLKKLLIYLIIKRRRKEKVDDDYLPIYIKSGRYVRRASLGLTIILSILLTMIIPMESCTETVTFTTTHEKCTTSATGHKDCEYETLSHHSILGKNEVCIIMKSDEDVPQQVLKLKVNPRTVCHEYEERITRIVNINTYSVKRCPSSGSCSANICQEVEPDTKIPELMMVNKLPGITRCVNSCGCWMCQCFLCTSGCTFYRIVARPVDDRIIKEIICRKWIQELEVQLEIQGNHPTFHNFTVLEGHSVDIEGLSISVSDIKVNLEDHHQEFITDGKVLAIADKSATAAVNLFTCSNLTLESCSINDINICSCNPTQDAVNCLCKQNYILDTVLSHKSVPSKNNIIWMENQKLIRPLSNALTNLVVRTNHYRIQTQVEYGTCEVTHSNLTGCINCQMGAQLAISCRSSYGNTLGFVNCTSFITHVFCDDTVQHQLIYVHSNTIDTCTISCNKQEKKFMLKSKLFHIINPVKKPSNFKEKTSTDIIQSFLSKFLFSSNIVIFLIIILVILIK